ncbi:MAG: hypothetical protein JKY11_00090 [Alphaproteobacteria bacterium]|nr:hypothetical protein [Alphaproteobacteria bacterium]
MTLKKQRAKAVEIKSHYEKAIWSPLNVDEIRELSVQDRCLLINKILKHNPQHHRAASTDTLQTSLQRLSSSFVVSDFFHNWQDQKRESFLRTLKKPRNRDILSGYAHWGELSIDNQKCVLKKSAQLHVKTYTEVLYGSPSYRHIFEEGVIRTSNGMMNIVYGALRSNITTGSATVVNYTLNDKLPLRSSEVFDTTHHEVTHLIQDYFARALYTGQITSEDPFYQEASYFLALSMHNANIPSYYGNSYRDQVHEILADSEGRHISSGIRDLAL